MAATEPTGEEALAEQAGPRMRGEGCLVFLVSPLLDVCLYLRTRSRRSVVSARVRSSPIRCRATTK